jgi:hypothetical protein
MATPMLTHQIRTFALLAPLTLTSLSLLGAQHAPVLEAGARVRVSTAAQGSGTRRIVGTLIALTGDRFAIRPERDSARAIELPRSALTRVEVSRGRHSKWLTGLGLGFAGGVAVGALIGYAAIRDDIDSGDAALIGAGLGSPVQRLEPQLVPRLALTGGRTCP